jgi:hypothetical protein
MSITFKVPSLLKQFHTLLEVAPAALGDLDLHISTSGTAPDHLQQDEQVSRTPVKDSVERSPVVAAQLPQLPSRAR